MLPLQVVLKTLKNPKGFSLIEIMVASATGIIVIMIAVLGLLKVTTANLLVRYTADEWANNQAIKQALPAYMGQGLDVDWTSGNINNIGGGRGKVRIYQSGFNATGAPQVFTTVAAFLRETGFPSPALNSSSILATAIYFREPSLNAPGELIISSSGPGFGPIQLNSSNYRRKFDSIVELDIRPGGFSSSDGDPVRVARVRVVTRRFSKTDPAGWRWCPRSELATRSACNTATKYVDQVQYINIPFANNTITTHFGSEETLYGQLYFFGMGKVAK